MAESSKLGRKTVDCARKVGVNHPVARRYDPEARAVKARFAGLLLREPRILHVCFFAAGTWDGLTHARWDAWTHMRSWRCATWQPFGERSSWREPGSRSAMTPAEFDLVFRRLVAIEAPKESWSGCAPIVLESPPCALQTCRPAAARIFYFC